jgi:hypothetical protein
VQETSAERRQRSATYSFLDVYKLKRQSQDKNVPQKKKGPSLAPSRSLPWEYALRQGCSQKPQDDISTFRRIPLHHPPDLLTEIERAISRERLKRYLAATAQNLEDAVSLYEQNVALSEMTFGLLHGLEVAIRNSMHDRCVSRLEELAISTLSPRKLLRQHHAHRPRSHHLRGPVNVPPVARRYSAFPGNERVFSRSNCSGVSFSSIPPSPFRNATSSPCLDARSRKAPARPASSSIFRPSENFRSRSRSLLPNGVKLTRHMPNTRSNFI